MNNIDNYDNEEYPNIPVEEDFSEVINLTEFNGSINPYSSKPPSSLVTYNKIDHIEVNAKHEKTARAFISKITKFVIDLDDDKLTEEHKKYLKTVSELEIGTLTDMLSLVDINKQLISNIIDKINETMIEDYAILSSFNVAVNQQVKLIKELSNMYRNIPSVLKRMKVDVITDQAIMGGNDANKDLITSDFGENQFNSQKQLLRTILENHKEGVAQQP